MSRPSEQELQELATRIEDAATIERLREDPHLAGQVIDIRTENDQHVPAELLAQHQAEIRYELLFLAVILPILLLLLLSSMI